MIWCAAGSLNNNVEKTKGREGNQFLRRKTDLYKEFVLHPFLMSAPMLPRPSAPAAFFPPSELRPILLLCWGPLELASAHCGPLVFKKSTSSSWQDMESEGSEGRALRNRVGSGEGRHLQMAMGPYEVGTYKRGGGGLPVEGSALGWHFV